MLFENLHPGEHILMVSSVDGIDPCGTPQQVVELCYPFVLLRHIDGQTWTLDFRKWKLTKCEPRYVKQAAGLLGPPTCPVCRDGVFACVTRDCSEPHWVCSECGAVVVEKACQCD